MDFAIYFKGISYGIIFGVISGFAGLAIKSTTKVFEIITR